MTPHDGAKRAEAPTSPLAPHDQPEPHPEPAEPASEASRSPVALNSSLGLIKRGRGQPKRMLTDGEIAEAARLAEIGASRTEIAVHIGVDQKTLDARCRDQTGVWEAMEKASGRMRSLLRKKQLQIAMTDGHPAQGTMLVWLGKVILGQTERINLKIETPGDALERLKAVWPELDSNDLIRQLAGEVIDVPVEEKAG